MIKATGVTQYFQAGPQTGTADLSGTTVLYVANKDGSEHYCLGCKDIVDGENGVRIFRVSPSDSNTPNEPERLDGHIIYANQNKELEAWHPNGRWLVAGIEMPKHALTHHLGSSEIGMLLTKIGIGAKIVF